MEHVYKDGFTPDPNDSLVTMKIGDKSVKWRNFLYGRAVAWDLSDDSRYRLLFPDSKDGREIAEAQRVLSETRGGRPLLNTLVIFIK